MANWSDNLMRTYFLVSNFYLVLFIINLRNPHSDLRVYSRRLRIGLLAFNIGYILGHFLCYIFSSVDQRYYPGGRADLYFFGVVISLIVWIVNLAAEALIPVPAVPAPGPIPAPAA